MTASGIVWTPNVTMSYWRRSGSQMLHHGKYEKERKLITGGLGYLGGRLAYHLLHHGHDVFVGTRKKIKSVKEPLSDAVPVQMDWDDFISDDYSKATGQIHQSRWA